MKEIKLLKKGFTLIELLVVVLIVGILAAIALPQYQKAVDRSRFSIMLNVAKAMAEANERFYMINNKYSTKIDELDIEISANIVSGSIAYFDWGKCTLYVQKGVSCQNIDNLKNKIFYGYYFGESQVSRNKILCYVKGNDQNSRYAKVCEGFGKYWHTSTCEEIGECMVYKIRG